MKELFIKGFEAKYIDFDQEKSGFYIVSTRSDSCEMKHQIVCGIQYDWDRMHLLESVIAEDNTTLYPIMFTSFEDAITFAHAHFISLEDHKVVDHPRDHTLEKDNLNFITRGVFHVYPKKIPGGMTPHSDNIQTLLTMQKHNLVSQLDNQIKHINVILAEHEAATQIADRIKHDIRLIDYKLARKDFQSIDIHNIDDKNLINEL